jgi:hypothetical protein
MTMPYLITPGRRLAGSLLALVLALLWFLPEGASAQPGKAHVHGFGTLLVAVEEEELVLELTVPGEDIVGFEHAAHSEEDKRRVKKALEVLKAADKLFRLDAGAGCRLEGVDVLAALGGEGGDKSSEHKHHHGHDHDKKGGQAEEQAHGEFRLRYHLHCKAPDRLKTLKLILFDRFPGLQEVNVIVVGPGGQSASRHDRARPQARF